MTSTYSIFKQKALEKFGQVAITNDAVYSSLKINITLLCETVNGLRDRVNALVNQYQDIVAISCDMSRSVHGLYEGSGQSLEMASSASVNNKKQLRDEMLPALKTAIQDKVISEIEAWASQLDSLQSKMNSREESRVCLDHYKNKVSKIRSAREQAQQRGKNLSRYASDWLDRNERKFEKSRLEFQTINESCCELMQAAWNKRFTHLSSVFTNLIQCEEALSAMVNASVVSCSGFLTSAHPLAITDGLKKTVLAIEPSENKDVNSSANVFELFGATPPIVTEPKTPPSSRHFGNQQWPSTQGTPSDAPMASGASGQFGVQSWPPIAPASSVDPFASFAEMMPMQPQQQQQPPQQKQQSGANQGQSNQFSIRQELFSDWPT